MSSRHNDQDGSDIFWPGYVDATTNLILNLLFLLTILIVAVFMFALELGRSSKTLSQKPPEVAGEQKNDPAAAAADLAGENVALKNEIKRLNMLLAQRASQDALSAGKAETVDVKYNLPKPIKGIDQTLAYESEILVRFRDGAVALTPAEHEQLLESLRPVAETGRAGIYVEVPAGFTEAKRMGFYRAMAVRNLLIEMNVATQNIEVAVSDGKTDANASVVRVRSLQ